MDEREFESNYRMARGIPANRPLTDSEKIGMIEVMHLMRLSAEKLAQHQANEALKHGGVRPSVEDQAKSWLALQFWANVFTGSIVFGIPVGCILAGVSRDVAWWHVVIWVGVSFAAMLLMLSRRSAVAKANWDRLTELHGELAKRGVKITNPNEW